jgi:cytidyltransferase-like protein
MIKVAISGYFDPIHKGHIEMIKLAKQLGDKLVVVLNNDKQVELKKGKAFMPLEDRKAILEAIKFVDEVFVSIDEDRSVCKSLEAIKPNIFANGGDRKIEEVPETKICNELGIEIIDGIGEKVQSSSDIIKKYEGLLKMNDEEIKPKRELLGTVYIVDGERVLLTWNKTISQFIPVGGHTDENELPCDCAVREAKEESGYDIKLIDGNDFKSHSIPQNFSIGLDIIKPDHHHINVAYAGKIVGGELMEESDEETELRWFTKEELENENLLDSVKEAAFIALDICNKSIGEEVA